MPQNAVKARRGFRSTGVAAYTAPVILVYETGRDFSGVRATKNHTRFLLHRLPGGSRMKNTRSRVGIAALSAGLVALIATFATSMGSVLEAQRAAVPADGYITGVVQGASAPEAGV